MQSKSAQQARNLNFPLSHEQIEIVTYKNSDGTFKNAEIVMSLLKKAFLEVNDTILGSRLPDSDNVLFFRILSITNIQLLEFKLLSGTNKVDYNTEKLISTIVEKDAKQIGHIVINAITKFFELFSHYYTVKSSRDHTLCSVVNNDLLSLLRSSSGVKIKYLDELLSLYLAFNGQTYFDVACHAVISGAYTFGSLFSITGLYHAAKSKLNGKTMLLDARQRSFATDYNVRDKGEIHTKQGLTVLYSRQFKLRPKRVLPPKKDVQYEVMKAIDEDQITADGRDKTLTSDSTLRRVYEQVKECKLLTFLGCRELEYLQHELLDVLNKDPSIRTRFKKEVKSGNISSLIHILEIFDDVNFKELLRKLDTYLVHKHDRMIIDKTLEIDLFGGSMYEDVFNRNLIRFLGLLESTPLESDFTNSIVRRFKNSSDCTDLVIALIDEFLEMIG